MEPNYLILTQIVTIFILPILLWYFRIIPAKFKWSALLAMFAVSVLIVAKEHQTLISLGLRVDNLKTSFLPYCILTIIGILLTIGFSKYYHKTPATDWWKSPHFFLGGFLIISLLQEFLYRGFLMPKLEVVFSSVTLVVIINAFLFMLPHLIYKNAKFIAVLTFSAGLVFAITYHFYPNLVFITLAHATLNFFAVRLGFFITQDTAPILNYGTAG